MEQHNHKGRAYSKTRLCQQVALSHQPEPVLNSSQITKRLRKSPKTIRDWLRTSTHSPKAFKDSNEWHVYLSDMLNWEQAQYKAK